MRGDLDELERDIQPDIMEDAILLGWDCRKVHDEGARGYPDLQCTRPVGKLMEGLLLEIKRPLTPKARRQQYKRHAELRAAGWKVHVVSDRMAARELLRR